MQNLAIFTIDAVLHSTGAGKVFFSFFAVPARVTTRCKMRKMNYLKKKDGEKSQFIYSRVSVEPCLIEYVYRCTVMDLRPAVKLMPLWGQYLYGLIHIK